MDDMAHGRRRFLQLVTVMDDMAHGQRRFLQCIRPSLQETLKVITTCDMEKVDRETECDHVSAHKKSSELSSVQVQTARVEEFAENHIWTITPEENEILAEGTKLQFSSQKIPLSQIS